MKTSNFKIKSREAVLRALAIPLVFCAVAGGSYLVVTSESSPEKSAFVPEEMEKSGMRNSTRVLATKKEERREKLASDQFLAAQNEGQIIEFRSVGTTASDPMLVQARNLVDSGFTKEANKLLNQILDKDPENIDALLELSLIEILDEKNPLGALPYLTRAVQIDPENNLILSEVASVYFETNRVAEGIRFFKSLLKVLPQTRGIKLRIGQLLVYERKPSQAVSHLNAALEDENLKAEAMGFLSKAYAQLKDSKKTFATYQGAALAFEEQIRRRLKSGEPVQYLTNQLERLQLEIGEELIRQGALDEAEAVLMKYLERHPADPSVIRLMNLARETRRKLWHANLKKAEKA